MRELGIDIAAYSGADLSESGAYRYAESPDFAILLIGYSIDNAPAEVCDLANGETLPAEVLSALADPAVLKTAHNASFARVCLSRAYGIGQMLDPGQWLCAMVQAARMGFPMDMGKCAEAMGLEQGGADEGKALARFFCKPDRQGGRHQPWADPEKWAAFKEWLRRRVDTAQAILAKTRRLHVPEFDRALWAADQRINDRGVLCDLALAQSAAAMDAERKRRLMDEARKLTGLANPNSPVQVKEWLERLTGQKIKSLSRDIVGDLSERLRLWPKAVRVLEIRKELAKTSNAKYGAMLGCACADGRLRGLLQFNGAARTGRWAGRLVQVQNLPQNHKEGIGYARSLAKAGDYEDFAMNYPNVSQTLSELIRTAFVAGEGKTLHVCDFSAIEARVIAWLAGEEWALETFREGGDLYCATASQMFGVPVEKHGINSELRSKGKIAVLALGYGGGVAALEAMGGRRLGLTEREMSEIVSLWRMSNPYIVALWETLERAAAIAAETGTERRVNRGITMLKRWGMLTVTLPSGRMLCYPRARTESQWGIGRPRKSIVYEGINQQTQKWETVRTYGGKLAENIVQAIARDILGEVMLRAEREGLDIVFHVHDEIVVEARDGQTLESLERLFSEPIPWCKGLPLQGAGYSTPYYVKD